MSVVEQLGVGQCSRLLARADQQWPAWSAQHRQLRAATDTHSLRAWLRKASSAEADDVLLALATLASEEGGDDAAAAAALAWALVPGACRLADRLRTLSPHIDQVVAGQLWIEARTFPWRRLRKVASNILCNTRVGVLRECGARSQLARADRTWSATTPVDPNGAFLGGHAAGHAGDDTPDAGTELGDLLEGACEADVISTDDRALLLCLAEAADAAGITRTGRSAGGLMANEMNEQVAGQWGISVRTLRRRARRSLDALSGATANGRIPA